MILVRKYTTFQAARKLTKIDPDHVCTNLHGHTFHVTIKIEGELNPHNDFVMDFDVDKIFNKNIYDKLDHSYLNDIQGLDSPTTKIYKMDMVSFKNRFRNIKEVRVFENDVYGCIYKETNLYVW